MSTILAAEIKKIGDFSDTDIDLFFSFLKESFLQKGDYFLQEGQVSRYLAYTLSGLTMHFITADGIEIPCDFTSEGQWLGYLKSFTSGLPADMAIRSTGRYPPAQTIGRRHAASFSRYNPNSWR